jgi:tyrosine-specific transport protein
MQAPLIRKGSLFGGILLVAGCCIGVGMLGLPILSAKAGFQPSVVIFFICWLFMVSTGLLLVEVNAWSGTDTSIITMAKKTLGLPGKIVSWSVFLFLFYSLMIAYVAASGSLISNFVHELTFIPLYHVIGNVIFCLLFGVLLFLGTNAVDRFNRFLMLGLLISYALLVTSGSAHVQSDLLAHKNWTAATGVIPVVIVSFGFHNLIPSLTNYFHGRTRPVILSIIIGSAVALFVYLIWEWIILGIVPQQDFQTAIDKGEIATEALRDAVGASWIVSVAQSFAFFAIITSLLSVALSFVDFLADGLQIKKTVRGRILLAFLVLAPPFLFATLYPSIFLVALNAAGGFGAVILFGILPVLMVWKGRYIQHKNFQPILFGGKPMLLFLLLFSLAVIALQFS